MIKIFQASNVEYIKSDTRSVVIMNKNLKVNKFDFYVVRASVVVISVFIDNNSL